VRGVQGIYAIGEFSGNEALKMMEVLEVKCGGGWGEGSVRVGEESAECGDAHVEYGKWQEIDVMTCPRYGAAAVALPRFFFGELYCSAVVVTVCMCV